jgi:integrase
LRSRFSGALGYNVDRSRTVERNVSLARIPGAKLKAILAGQHPPAFIHDGGGLYLKVTPSGASWIFRYSLGGLRKMGLGSLRDVTATAARELASGYRASVAAGHDPKMVRADKTIARTRDAGRSMTFKAVAEPVLVAVEASDLSPVTKRNWRASLETHVYPKLGNRLIDSITRGDVLDVLRPLWRDLNPTARSIRQRIETVYQEARNKELTDRPNPALWADLKPGLAHYTPNRKKKPHAALPWQDVPAFYRRLKAQDGYTPRALMLTILAANRTQETLGTQFTEFARSPDGSLAGGVWTIPAERMKGRVGQREPHHVPITDEIAAVVEELEIVRRTDFLFPHRRRRGEHMTRSSLKVLLDKLKVDHAECTVHGFRSTFRDWATDNGLNDKAAERALAHKVQGVQGHYDRTTMLQMRFELMQRWADFVTGRVAMAKPSVVLARSHLQLVGGSAA